MHQDAKTIKTAIATDLEGLALQLASLRDDITKLTSSVSTLAGQQGRKMASDITDGLNEAANYIERKSTGAEAELEKSVASHPLIALGLAACVGMLVGAMTRRS